MSVVKMLDDAHPSPPPLSRGERVRRNVEQGSAERGAGTAGERKRGPERFWFGDLTSKAVERYRGCRQLVVKGGDHAFSDFGDYLEMVLEFCGAISRQCY